MSPEQARGKTVDKRTDIWAFGCVLYEMLTGRVVFPGATIADMMAAILEREPDWKLLPARTPPGIRRLLERCLEKDPKRRLRDIGDARIQLDEQPTAVERRRAAWLWPACTALFLTFTAVLTVLYFSQAPPAQQTLTFEISTRGLGARTDARLVAGRDESGVCRESGRPEQVVGARDGHARLASTGGHRRCRLPLLVTRWSTSGILCRGEAEADRGARRPAAADLRRRERPRRHVEPGGPDPLLGRPDFADPARAVYRRCAGRGHEHCRRLRQRGSPLPGVPARWPAFSLQRGFQQSGDQRRVRGFVGRRIPGAAAAGRDQRGLCPSHDSRR